MAYVASSEYSRVTSESTERRGPRFGMEKGTRIDPGQVYFNGKYVNEKEIFKVRQTHEIKNVVIENRIIYTKYRYSYVYWFHIEMIWYVHNYNNLSFIQLFNPSYFMHTMLVPIQID